MIDKVKGVVIEPNGIAHSFGKCRMVLNTTADEAHDPSFKREILPKEWFKKYGYDYKQDETLFSQIPEMTKYGFSFVINHSSVNPRGTNYYCYSIQIAKESIPNIKNYFQNIYPIIKEVQDVPEPCYVEGMIYENGCEALEDIIYDVDEFYEELGFSKQEEYIKSIYPQINKIIANEEKAYFELALYSEGIPLIDMLAESIEELDEFYEKIGLDIEKTGKIAKSI